MNASKFVAASVALTVLAVAGSALATLGARRGGGAVVAAPLAQAVPAAAGRVLFDPGPPDIWVAKVRDGITITQIMKRGQGGLVAQNLGDEPTRLLSLDAWPFASDAGSCERCYLTRTLCSGTLAPGATWRVSATVAVLSLSERRAADVDAAWVDAAVAEGLGTDATVADVVCAHMARWRPSAGAPACPGTAFIDAFVRGGASDALPNGLDAAMARGEPIGGVIEQLGAARSAGGGSVDRFEALGLADTGWAPPPEDGGPRARFVYDLPGAWIRSPDGLSSAVRLFNPAGACATVVVSAYRTSNGLRGVYTRTLKAGALDGFDLDSVEAFADVNGSATVRLVSDRPLAAALTVVGPDGGRNLSYTVPAIRMPTAPLPSPGLRQLMPLGYQEKVSFAADAAMSRLRSPGGEPGGRLSVNPELVLAPAQEPLDRAQGWETSIPVFNPYAERLELANRMQAEGEPRREFGYPLVPRVQTVLQPGFGLGKPGGDGWGEMFAAVPLALPLSIAVHSWREARDVPVPIEGWGVRTWSFDWADWTSTAPRFIGLPDLGGPAVASPDDPAAAPIALTGTMTDTFGGRIAVQNPLTQTARIAIDTYAPACGYAGTLLRTIDARQRILVDVRDLPGVAHGADAAVVRILEGAVAAMVEFRRPAWLDLADAPPDIASAYLGTPIDATDAGPQPEPLAARLAVTPTALTVDRAALTPLRVLVGHMPDAARCAAFTATADVPWLTVTPAGGAFPAVVTLTVDARRLPASEATGVLTIASADATITGSPQRVTVTVTGEAVHVDPGKAYVPYVVRLAGR